MNAAPVHGKARLIAEDGKITLVINGVPYLVKKLHPDVRVADPAVSLTKEDGTEYHLCVDEWGPRCDCGDCHFRSRMCKHLGAATACGLLEKR